MKCEVCGKEVDRLMYTDTCSEECFTIKYWRDRINNQSSKTQVVVDHKVFQIADENSNSGFRGFDGRRFFIEFFDGRKVETTNLWYNGVIPEDMRKDLPDNARFLTYEEYHNVKVDQDGVLKF